MAALSKAPTPPGPLHFNRIDTLIVWISVLSPLSTLGEFHLPPHVRAKEEA